MKNRASKAVKVFDAIEAVAGVSAIEAAMDATIDAAIGDQSMFTAKERAAAKAGTR